MNPLFENPPPIIADEIRRVVPPDDEILIQVKSDVGRDGRFSEPWIIVTAQRFALVGDGEDSLQAPLSSFRKARAEAMIGGGSLIIERNGDPAVQIPYTNSLAQTFGEVAVNLNLLLEGKPTALPTQFDATRCGRCGRLLPERGGICPACIRKIDTLLRLLSYLLPYFKMAIALVVLTLASTLLDLAPPLIIRHIIDDVLMPHGEIRLLFLLAGCLLGISTLAWFAGVARRWLNNSVGCRAAADLRMDLYRALQFLPLRFHEKRKVGSLVSRMTNDAELVEDYLSFDLPFVLSNGLLFVGILILLFVMNWQLAYLVVLPIPIIVIVGSLLWRRLESTWRRWSARWSSLASHLNESIKGIRMVKAFTREEFEARRFDSRNLRVMQASIAAERTWMVFFLVSNFVMSFGLFLVWYFGGKQIIREELTLGALIAFIVYLWMVYQPLRWFGDFYSFMVRAFAGAERIFEVIDARPEPFKNPEAKPLTRMEGKVVFENVSFGYDPGKPVLHGIDFEVEPGEMIGLVGHSGAGKSTLINLVCRFYDVTRGSIRVDDRDLRDIRIEDLRGHIGMVAQQTLLFSGTVAKNIAYGRPNASTAEVIEAARAANAHEFIIRMPDGYDSQVGENGGKLSGGEKQRLAIARAILQNPRILILDEATSSLDTATEHRIQEAIAHLVKGRTTFAIAHRLSTLRSADRLFVLDRGKIVETGTHTELIARRGHFYRLVQAYRKTVTGIEVRGEKMPA